MNTSGKSRVAAGLLFASLVVSAVLIAGIFYSAVGFYEALPSIPAKVLHGPGVSINGAEEKIWDVDLLGGMVVHLNKPLTVSFPWIPILLAALALRLDPVTARSGLGRLAVGLTLLACLAELALVAYLWKWMA